MMNHRTAASPAPLVYAQKNHLFAVDRQTGQLCWKFDARRAVIRVVLAGDNVYALDLDCKLYCIRQADGQPLGEVAAGPESAWGAAILAHDGCLYVGTSVGVTAFTMDGRKLWHFATDDPGIDSTLPGLALPGAVVQPDKKD